MIIGIPKEIMPSENRVAATPETVRRLAGDGLTVWVESGAGLGALHEDRHYGEAGAVLVPDVQELYARADVILKVKEPQFHAGLNRHEVDLMHAGQVLITFLHPASPANHEMIRALAARGVTGITLDGIPRISRAQQMDALTSMSTCAGYKGILLAANALPRFMPMIASAIGMIKPVQTLVVGIGVAGLQALATAKRLGAVCYAADIRPAAREQAQSLGAKIVEVGVPDAEAVGDGGYALALTPERVDQERRALAGPLREMDIVFLSALVPGKKAPILITEEMVRTMKPGSVIVDISIDQGGNCAVTPPGKTEIRHQVTCIGIKNIPGLLPVSATWMFAHNIAALLRFLVKDGTIRLDLQDAIIRSALTTYEGRIVHKGALEAMAV